MSVPIQLLPTATSGGRNPVRGSQRLDALDNLHPIPLASQDYLPQDSVVVLQQLLCSLYQLDFWALQIASTAEGKPVEYGDFPTMQQLPDQNLGQYSDFMKSFTDRAGNQRYAGVRSFRLNFIDKAGTSTWYEVIDKYITGLPPSALMPRLRDNNTLPLLSTLFNQAVSNLEFADTGYERYEEDIRTDFEDFDDETHNYLKTQSQNAASSLEKIFRLAKEDVPSQLSDCASILDDETLSILRLKMTHLQRGYKQACRALGKEAGKLVDPSSDPWWDTSRPAEQKSTFQPANPAKIAEAYPTSSSNTDSLLKVLVPTLSLVAGAPVILTWKDLPNIGSSHDPDFYLLISSSVMQLLGVVTLMIPIVSKTHLNRLPWLWTWVLAGTSAICSVATVILYCYVPTNWAMAVSFVGGFMQALVTLQLVFAI